jgi:hypothetical protein
LLIRNAEADDVAGMDEQALKVGCNMAQVFEFQKGDRRAHRDPSAGGLGCEPPRGTSKAFFQIAAPGPIRDRIGISNMGLPPDRRKHSTLPLARSADRPDSRLGYPRQD